MTLDNQEQRFVYYTEGVCPPEIHFKIQKDHLKQIRFVGGGCPGNAQLVCRLLEGKPIAEVLELLKGVSCRDDTSCPDQLAKALIAATSGELNPAPSFRVYTDLSPRNRVALIGDIDGRCDLLAMLLRETSANEVDAVYCLGNLLGNLIHNDDRELMRLLKKEGLTAILGEKDWRRYAQGKLDSNPGADRRITDRFFRLPHVLSFTMAKKKGMAFFGEYIQNLSGFSDFDPFALEMNMVCNLTQFMQDETVFPALEAMIPQFEAQIILFSQLQKWGHWTIGETLFISLGPVLLGHRLSWGLLETAGDKVNFSVMNKDLATGG